MNVKHGPWCDALRVTAVAVTVGTGATVSSYQALPQIGSD